eukprot:TRINITY_DN4256_c1_g1_i2.p1 TRINITY_DN4256_c1_g1~~TRINITY_DN4256_c1_g1_i2.p1  ORF type:complete len:279 (+),score=77.91 TRINITY_DN4256_c1_g1_i2:94-837(+)
MLRRTAIAGFKQTQALQHYDTDQLYGRNYDPIAPAANWKRGQENMRRRKIHGWKPYNNQYGHRWLYRGGEMWRVVDARGMEMEGLAEMITLYLQGRHRPDWKREMDMGDQIIILNARHITMDDNEGTPLPWRMKPYAYKTGYPKAWGLQLRRADEEYLIDPCRPLWLAIYERLPRMHPVNRAKKRSYLHLRYWIEKVHIFADEEHPFKDKDPIPLEFPIAATGTEEYTDSITMSNIQRRKKPQGWKY